MRRVQRLLGWVDRVQRRSRWLGFPFAVMGKFRDDHGGALTTVIAYNAFFALFPLLLVVVTVLGFLLGRDSGFQQRLLGSAVAEFPIIGDQVQDNIHGLRGSGVGLVVGLVVFAWGARGLTQVAQHAMAEIWNIPGRQRPRFWARQVRGLLLLVVFAVGLGAVSVLTWLGSYGGKAVAVALANLAAAAAVNVGLFLLAFRVLTPRQIPTRQLLAGAVVAGVAWQVLQAVGGFLVGHYLRHTSQVYGVFAIVLGLLFWLYLGARLTLYAAEVNVVAARRLWPGASNDYAWPSATPEPRPRGPLLGPAVSLTVARLGDPIGRMEKLSLDALAREQMKAATAAPAGRSARTVYGGHEHVLRQTLMALTAGASMSEHENPGEATVHVLHGRVRLVADGVAWEGRDGDLLIVPQAPHTLHALEDAAVLLTVAKLP
ncbi:MAG TPA: YhjD/YihY/BrkB family envelope integrity protein [Actinomycetota bacterium]|nr:YhjD/YihY/BrkB family envelope integrity protein [Actinomycetota bacterium]